MIFNIIFDYIPGSLPEITEFSWNWYANNLDPFMPEQKELEKECPLRFQRHFPANGKWSEIDIYVGY